jgi:FkbM family methyltransferase
VGVGYNHHEVAVLKEEWPGVRFIGFEPHADVYRMAKEEGWYDELYQVAISDHAGEASLNIKKRHADGSSLKDVIGDCKKQKVRVETLDGMLDGIVSVKGCALLWLDCEGNEDAVIRGAGRTMKLFDVVNVEITANPPGKGWCSPVAVHQLLIGVGYFAQWTHTDRVHEGQHDMLYARASLFDPRFCCFPQEIERFELSRMPVGPQVI